MDNVMQEMVLPTRKETLVDQIHDKILEIIIQEDVSERSVFTEGKLVQQFQVSKATVREALVRLCNESILRSIPRYGYVIAYIGLKDLHDLEEFRRLLELTSLRETAPRIGRPELDQLRAMLSRHSTGSNKTVWDIWKKNMEFHSLLISFSGNRVFVEFLQDAMRRQMLYFGQSRWQENRSFADFLHTEQHEKIYTSLESGNAEQALACLASDIAWPVVPEAADRYGALHETAHV